MNKIYSKLLILLTCVIFLSACHDTRVGDIDLDFNASLEESAIETYVGKPVKIGIKVGLVDPDNKYPFETRVKYSDGLMKSGTKSVSSDEKIMFDYRSEGTLWIEFIPSQSGDQTISIYIANEKVNKVLQCEIGCKGSLYEFELKDAPIRPLIETKFDFSLLLTEMESTGSDSIVAYAKVIKGEGTVYAGEDIINIPLTEGENTEKKATKTTLLAVGKNNISYHSTKEGENILRFFVTNKWGHETFQDISTNINLPDWTLKNSEGKQAVTIPLNDNYSFTLDLTEKDIFKENSYEGFFRVLSNTDLALNVNDKAYKQGATIPLRAGGNVAVLNVKAAGTGAIEFIVKDKFKQERKDTLNFISNLPIKPIEGSLDKSSQATKINQAVTFKLSLSELNYNDVFDVKMDVLTGAGNFEGGATHSFSEGSHTIKFTPTKQGTHTFKITIKDKNNQEKVLNATVQATVSKLTASLNLATLNIGQGERGEINLDASEPEYTGRFYIKYALSGVAGKFEINNVALGAGQKAFFTNTSNKIHFTGTEIGETTLNITVSDDYEQEIPLTLKVITKAKITATAATGGAATGGGSFALNQSVTLKATANTGFSFLGWYNGNNLVSGEANYTFKATQSIALEARFGTKAYAIVATAETGGTATGGGNFEHGKTAILKATPSANYEFSGWYEGATKVSSSLEYTITVSTDKSFIAKFTPKDYTITVSAETGGTATGGGDFAYGTTQTVKAVANTGYAFSGWYQGSTKVSDNMSFSFVVKNAATLVAKFEANKVNLTVNAATGGTTTGSGAFAYNSSVTVTATPSTGYVFDAWYNGTTKVSASASYTFVIKDPTTLEARFTPKEFTVTVNAATGGTVSGGGKVKYDAETTVTAVASTGYAFSGWYEGSSKVSESLSYKFKVTGDKTLEAKFEANKVNIVVNAATGGTATGSGTFSYNATATVKATADENHTFDGWYNGNTKVSPIATYSFTVTGALTLEARFTPKSYTITVSAETGGTATGGGDFAYGTTQTVKAVANTGYAFSGWYQGTTKVSDNMSFSFVVKNAATLVAKFEANKFNVTATAATGGTVTGSGAFAHGSSVTVTATALTNYTFEGWYEGATKVSASASYSFTVTGALTLEARFTANKFNVTVNAQAGGTVTGSGSFDFNSTATVKATLDENYTFLGWYEGSTNLSTSLTYQFTVTKAITLEARFAAKKFNVTVNAATGGTVSGSGSFDYNSNVTVAAIVNTGYTFDGWYNGATRVSTSTSYTFVLKAATTLEARFTAKNFTVVLNAQTGGTATGGGSFAYGANATVTASVQTGYAFTGWYEGSTQASTTPSYTFKVEKDRSLEARFTANKFNIVVNAETGGTVTGSGSFAYGSNATVTATLATNYTFDGWYNGATRVSTNLAYTFTVNGALTLTAKFIINKHTVTLSGTNGTQTGGGTFNYGSNATLTATPSANYQFVGWYEGTTQLSTSNPYVFAVQKNIIIEAKYELVKRTVSVVTSTGGTVSGGGTVSHGSNVTVTATPSAGYQFDGWYNGATKVSSTASYTFAATSTISLTAKFTIKAYVVTAATSTGGTVSGGGTINHGSNATVVATPASNYDFEGWYNGATKVSSTASYTFAVTTATTLTAKFTPKKYTITPVTSTGGTVSGGGSIAYGSNATVTASPSANYNFEGWYNGATKVSSTASYTFSVAAATTLTAKFVLKTYTVTASTSTGGTVSGGGTVSHGANATVTATPSTGYQFEGWYNGATKVSSTASYTFSVTAATTLTAKFVVLIYLKPSIVKSDLQTGTTPEYRSVKYTLSAYTKINGVEAKYSLNTPITVTTNLRGTTSGRPSSVIAYTKVMTLTSITSNPAYFELRNDVDTDKHHVTGISVSPLKDSNGNVIVLPTQYWYEAGGSSWVNISE